MKSALSRTALVAGIVTLLCTVSAQTVVSFWSHTHPPMVELNERLIAEFEAQNPDIAIEYQVIPNSQFFEHMIISLSTGAGPDIINMGNAQLRSDYIPRGLVVPVDPVAVGYESFEELEANYLASGLLGAEVDGEIYGLPSEFNTTMLLMHVPDLVEAGFDADWRPVTWDELGEAAGQLSRFDDGGNQTHRGFDFFYLHASWYGNQFGILAEQTGCELYNEEGTESLVNSAECIQAAQIWQDMIYKYEAANPRLTAGDSTIPQQDYIAENVSMTLIEPWGMELVRDANPERWENSVVVPLPQVDPENPSGRVSAYYWAVNSDSQVQEAAWQFVGFMADHPEAWLEDVNFLQATAGLSDEAMTTLPFLENWNEALDIGQFGANYPNANETTEALRESLESILLSNADVADTFGDLKTRLDRALR